GPRPRPNRAHRRKQTGWRDDADLRLERPGGGKRAGRLAAGHGVPALRVRTPKRRWVMQKSEYMEMMQRDDDSLSSADLIATYERGIDDLRPAVAGMTTDQALARPVPGRWSTVECVGHLADTEVFFTDRIVRTVAMDRPLLMSADEKQYIE